MVAFSGGLDTTWLVARAAADGDRPVVTVTVDTGGFDADEIRAIAARSREAGATRHVLIDGRQAVFDRFVRFLVAGNSLRGGTYPLCVAAERIVQAEQLALAARDEGVRTVVHGSTGAGNDQIRFDVALAVLLPGADVQAPVRDLGPSREDEYADLEARGISVSHETKTYSVNRGLWGTTIGGGDLHKPERPIPAECWVDTTDPDACDAEGEILAISFKKGIPVAVDGHDLGGPELVTTLNCRAGAHGVGRGIHTGDTILGIKGRLAFEAPGAAVLIFAHRELEKLVLTKRQMEWKDRLGAEYAAYVHEALYFDPVARDIEAFLASTQRHVTGTVRVRCVRGRIEIVGVETDASLMGRLGAVYGEGMSGWTGAEAKGFAKIYGLPSVLAARRDAACGNAATDGKGSN